LSGFITLMDELIDCCNAMIAGLKTFYLIHLNSGPNIPQQLFLEELQAETETPWWHVVGFVTRQIQNQKQLLIYTCVNTDYLDKARHSVFSCGILAEFFAQKFDSFSISMRSNTKLMGWSVFQGKKLREIRKNNPKSMEDYKEVLENSNFFFASKFGFLKRHILGRIDTYSISYKIRWQLLKEDLRKQFSIPTIKIRSIEIHRNGWRAVVNGSIFVSYDNKAISKNDITRVRRKILKQAISKARSSCTLFRIEKYLPVGFIRIALFCKDYRARKLENFGLASDLIGTIEVKKIKRIRAPDIYNSSVEVLSKYRLAWNSAWLKAKADKE
jgi:hypothetical protein